jgi:hypothetical protein
VMEQMVQCVSLVGESLRFRNCIAMNVVVGAHGHYFIT